MYRLGRGGHLEPCASRPELPKGTIVYGIGPGCSESRWAMTGNGNEIVKLSANSAEAYFSSPFRKLDRYARPVSQKFGIGFYYDIEEKRATDAEIALAIERGKAFIEEQERIREEEEQAHRRALDAVRQKYAGVYPEHCDTEQIAAIMRRELKAAFPGCRFSVRKEDYSHIDIEWEDGPSDIRDVVGKWENRCTPDKWNPDMWDHERTPFNEVYGGVDYLFFHRSISEGAMRKVENEIREACPGIPDDANGVHYSSMDRIKGLRDVYCKYFEHLKGVYWLSARSIARAVLQDTDLYQAQARAVQ